jgi:hypothetical protein
MSWNALKKLELKYPILGIDSQSLEIASATKILCVNLNPAGGLQKTATGVGINLAVNSYLSLGATGLGISSSYKTD